MATQRLFLALFPSHTIQRRLAEAGRALQAHVGGRCVATPLLHLTLAFLGDTSDDIVPALCDRLAAVSCASFDLTLDQVGVWPQAGIGWMQPTQPPAALWQLHRSIQQQLQALGLPVEQRAFKPHITLLRKAPPSRGPLPPCPAIDWPVTTFQLIASTLTTNGPQYRPLASWPLASA
ncbi:2'-5' RNA ligase [Chitinivorax tropicus]|uniref:RNA 2',3'-cyclic phosphodiesterase n=1 Tax=Chitinivorax tropicus TaxID=714531 RepID=A0A840MJ72_9PROT|nr:RNA 2',3'-cyclic phosphodiesterase [Chitinivorax tropicus]MBB5018460.1 2'-5' RNA ligase [Chitinivorax tropicus]